MVSLRASIRLIPVNIFWGVVDYYLVWAIILLNSTLVLLICSSLVTLWEPHLNFDSVILNKLFSYSLMVSKKRLKYFFISTSCDFPEFNDFSIVFKLSIVLVCPFITPSNSLNPLLAEFMLSWTWVPPSIFFRLFSILFVIFFIWAVPLFYFSCILSYILYIV